MNYECPMLKKEKKTHQAVTSSKTKVESADEERKNLS